MVAGKGYKSYYEDMRKEYIALWRYVNWHQYDSFTQVVAVSKSWNDAKEAWRRYWLEKRNG